MRKLLWLAVMAIILFACSKEKEKEFNVVKDAPPVHRWDKTTYNLLDSLAKIPDSQKLAFINKNLPHLTPALYHYIYNIFHTPIDTVVYTFGSGDASGTIDSAGVEHNGVYDKELLAYVYLKRMGAAKNDKKADRPIKIFVRCLNGTFEISGDKRLGRAANEYVIDEPGQSWCDHLDYETTIWLAEKFNIPLYKGKKFKAKFRITPDQARKINTNVCQVSILDHLGDRLILFGEDARYIPAK